MFLKGFRLVRQTATRERCACISAKGMQIVGCRRALTRWRKLFDVYQNYKPLRRQGNLYIY